MAMLYCTNTNDFTHTDRFDGEDYVFPPKEKVALTVDAARHMFGFREADKNPTLHRLGWSMKYDPVAKAFADDPEGLKKLAGFVFSEAVLIEKPLVEKDEKTLHLKKPEARV